MPFILPALLSFQGSAHLFGVGSFSKKKLDAVTREIESRAVKARALDAFERELREIDTLSVSFTSSRWNAMVERVDVLADGRMVFRFVCGREIVI